MSEVRLIDGARLIKKFCGHCSIKDACIEKCIDARIIESMPTIDPVKHGRWIEHKGGDDYIGYPIYECSECGYDAGETATNYCPNCGARMDEVTE